MRSTVVAIALGAAVPVAASVPHAVAAADAVETLADQLKTGLRVQAPGDVEFCDEVARLVRIGRLPAKLVDGTYVWAIRRGKKYPFPAFAAALRLKAARLGVRLP
ncbi:MAG: hypothetical protein ACKOSQ_11590 [Planctomycetaceae bacterium]